MERNSRHNARRLLTVVAVIAVIALVGLLVVDTAPGLADNPSPEGALAQVADIDGGAGQSDSPVFTSALPSLARMTGALLVVIACIYIGLYLLKRLTMKRYSANGRYHLLEVLETTCIAPKKTVSLIKVADKAVLVAMTDSHISLLTELDREQTAQILASQTHGRERDRFGELLKSVSQRVRQVAVKRNRADLETQPVRPVN